MADKRDMYEGVPKEQITPPMYKEENNSNFSLIKELSPREDLQDILKNMEGKVYDSKKSKYIDVDGASEIANERGRNAFFHWATTLVSRINSMSNYTNDYDKIHAIVGMVVKRAAADFYTSYREYGIRKENINKITTKLTVFGMSIFYRAIGAGDRKAATQNISQQISQLTRQDGNSKEKKGGFFSRIFG